jgi:hypothetical protein
MTAAPMSIEKWRCFIDPAILFLPPPLACSSRRRGI